MADLPKISVVVTTRNRCQTLKRMLDKLFENTYPRLEVIVVDAASTDGTVELLRSYGTRISNWISEPDGGEYFGINKGIRLATGEIIKPMSDDDELRPEILQKVGTYFLAHPEVGVVFGQTVCWEDRDGTSSRLYETAMTDVRRLSLRHWLREQQTVKSLAGFVRRKVFDAIGPFATEYVCGDVEYWVRAASRGITMGLIPDIVLDYHYTGFNGIITKRWRAAADLVRINRKYGTIADVMHSVWRKYVKPFTYRPAAEIVKKGMRLVGADPTAFTYKRRGVKA